MLTCLIVLLDSVQEICAVGGRNVAGGASLKYNYGCLISKDDSSSSSSTLDSQNRQLQHHTQTWQRTTTAQSDLASLLQSVIQDNYACNLLIKQSICF